VVYIFFTAFIAVFLVELAGDKTVYTVSSLCTRLPARQIYVGISLAFMVKMRVAVMMGHLIGSIPPKILACLNGATFFLMAAALWRKREERSQAVGPMTGLGACVLAFSSVFFSEWADGGQLTAAALSARYQVPFLIWGAGTLALMTKGLLAVGVGKGLRHYFPSVTVRPFAVAVAVVLGILSLSVWR
jgi:putative Ca2+/H+ antiporter (TMEM165/GDT1 family)